MRSLFYCILFSLFLSHSVLAEGEKASSTNATRMNVLRQYNAQFTRDFIKRLWIFNKNRKSPEFFVKVAKDKSSKKFMKDFLYKNKIQEFPKITMEGETAKMRVGGITVEFSVLDAFHNRIRVNGHVYELDTQMTLKHLHGDFKKFLETEVGLTASAHHWMDHFISAAHASEGFELVLGAVMALKVEGDPELDEYNWGGWGWFGDSHGVEEALDILKSVKEKKRKCQEEQDLQRGRPDAVFVDSGTDTAKMFSKLGYYSSGTYKEENEAELKRMSKELMDYLEDEYGRSSSSKDCEKMGESLFNLNDPEKNLLAQWYDKEGMSTGRGSRENKEKAFINSLCQDMNALETCMARFDVDKMKIHDGDRERKPASDGGSYSGGGHGGSSSKSR